MILRHKLVGQLQHLGGGLGVQSSGVLVQEQELGLFQRGHQQRQRLTLAAGEKAHLAGEPVLQAKAQTAEHLLVPVLLGLGKAPPKPPLLTPAGRQGQILHDLHGGRGAHHGVLEHPADEGRPPVLRQVGDIGAADGDGALVHRPGAGHGVEHGALSGAVAADDGAEVPLVQGEAHPPQGLLLVDGPGVEGLPDLLNLKHLRRLPSSRALRNSGPSSRAGTGTPPPPGRRGA